MQNQRRLFIVLCWLQVDDDEAATLLLALSLAKGSQRDVTCRRYDKACTCAGAWASRCPRQQLQAAARVIMVAGGVTETEDEIRLGCMHLGLRELILR